ncbi:MAG: GUN4 domain-containing protein, partial [Bacteroidota bacterium]
RSFQEFLAAAAIRDCKLEEELYKHHKQVHWHGIIELYAALIKPIKFTRFLEKLIAQDTREATSLAHTCLQEKQRLVSLLSPEELQVLNALAVSIRTSRFEKLKNLLAHREWKDADYETYCLMIQTVGKEEGQELDIEDLEDFPQEELQILDKMWTSYSKGKWGFSIQKDIYSSVGGNKKYSGKAWQTFCDRIGWQRNSLYISYDMLTFDLDLSQIGHLPVIYLNLLGWRAWTSLNLTKSLNKDEI